MCSLYLGDQIISGQATLVGESRNIGQIIPSTIPLTDAGLHLLDGSLIQGSGIYSAFVTAMAAIYETNPELFCTESEWQDSITQYGVCGKFVYDATANTVRLPKYSNKIYTQELDSTAPVVGNGMTLGITDGTNNYGFQLENSASNYVLANTSQYGKPVGTNSIGSGTSSYKTYGITSDSTKSGIIAQLSDITTSLDGYYYIVIATSAKTDIQVDIDEIATDLNGKADVDLSNINASQSAKNEITSWGMPDYSAGISMGLPTTPTSATTTTYTCPSAGLVSIAAYKSSAGNSCYVFVNGVAILTWTGYSAFGAAETLPVSKNDVIRISTDVATTGWTILWQQFYPLKGEA